MYLKKAGFPQVWHNILAMTPEDRLIDYKLVWREALKTWLSPSHRSALMGDAAHWHLPTSAQGACMAVEDAAAMAICLQKAKNDVPLALQAFLLNAFDSIAPMSFTKDRSLPATYITNMTGLQRWWRRTQTLSRCHYSIGSWILMSKRTQRSILTMLLRMLRVERRAPLRNWHFLLAKITT